MLYIKRAVSDGNKRKVMSSAVLNSRIQLSKNHVNITSALNSFLTH